MAVTALLILDGFGIGGSDPKSNAILAAGTPNIDRLKAEYCSTAIGASGLDVGLPDGQMGNSEVGHTNIGAGRIVYQELTRITKSAQDGDCLLYTSGLDYWNLLTLSHYESLPEFFEKNSGNFFRCV